MSRKPIGQRSACWVVLMTLLVSVIGEGGAWAQQVQSFTPPAESEVEYYHTDVIGSVRLVTNLVGQVTKRQDFSPYGTPLTGIPSSAQPRGFAGKERDDQTGFDYFGGRYLLSNVSRFTTVDPVLDADTALVDPQRWNRYVYVRNNPLVHTDPDGRSSGMPAWAKSPWCSASRMRRRLLSKRRWLSPQWPYHPWGDASRPGWPRLLRAS